MSSVSNIYRLGIKELWSLWHDPAMIVLIFWLFTSSVYTVATSLPDTLNRAMIAIVDEDHTEVSMRIAASFYPPNFRPPKMISLPEIDSGMDAGKFTFALDIPLNFQRDVIRGSSPAIQLNVDATQVNQAFIGSGYIQQIVLGAVDEFVRGYRANVAPQVDLLIRARFNPTLTNTWFRGVMELINNVTMLSIILAGAAIIREREHGTVEHLLVMPVTPGEIMLSKVWSTGLVVLCTMSFSLIVIIHKMLEVPIGDFVSLFLLCTGLHLFATTSMGIFMATMVRSMPQFGLLMMLVMWPLSMLSGGMTPMESMPIIVQKVMLTMPTTHFVSAAQTILYRNTGIEVVWPNMLIITAIGVVFFSVSLAYFRKTIGQLM